MNTIFNDIIHDSTMEDIEPENNMITFNEANLSLGNDLLDDGSELSSQISFSGHIDELYDPSIKTAQDNFAHHLKEAIEAKTTNDFKFHIEHAKEARNSEDFWQDAKHDAELESRKNEIFIDGINKQWEIMDKYQKEIENICRR